MDAPQILIADDDKKTRDFVSAFLSYKGYRVVQAADGQEALDRIAQEEIHLVITDVMMPRVNGLEFIRRLKSIKPDVITIAYSAFANSEMTAGLLKSGAYFFLEKPFNLDELETHVRRGLEHHSLQDRAFHVRPPLRHSPVFSNIIGESTPMLSLFELIEKVAASDSTVLLTGESGTGKELVARAIHELSPRKNRNFVPVNCAAIPDDLLESELFGHIKGSFTGAVANRLGRFEIADRGTLFLDEIGDMKPHLQVKLLRVLQNREIEPVGATSIKKVDVRIIAATNQHLDNLVAERKFREDLYYRLTVIPIHLPPLRERRSDIPLLVRHFMTKFGAGRNRTVSGIAPQALDALCRYDWPGNVRELENLIERLTILKGSGPITLGDIPEKYRAASVPSGESSLPVTLPEEGFCLNTIVEEFENRMIIQALERTGGNKKEAARLLNLKRTTLIEKLKKRQLGRISPLAAVDR
ncbi:MAG: sigma-54 dependent transcriptional regulator [Desulfuromonadia bacterium]